MKRFFTLLLFTTPLCIFAQVQTALDIAARHLEAEHVSWGLDKSDIADLAVSNAYTDAYSGNTHVYLIQRHNGIEVYNAIANLHIHEGKVFHSGNRLIPRLNTKVNAVVPVLEAEQALRKAIVYFGMPEPKKLTTTKRVSAFEMTFEKGQFSREDVPVKLRYQPMENGQVRLAWDIAIDAANGNDYWSIRIDALNGQVLDQVSWTVKCTFEQNSGQQCNHSHAVTHKSNTTLKEARSALAQEWMATDGTYNVFTFPLESPAHGSRSIVVNPADPIASPFGWHDTNGVPGPEFTITRGNNVHTFEARDGNTSSKMNEPNGGPGLVFDYPYDGSLEPDTYVDFATVNLFYSINMIHDIAYHYGFTEEAGNFQQTNYSGLGSGGDYVRGRAQFGATNNANLNNADFSTPPDGGGGVMRMFLWDRSSAGALKYLHVDAPSEIAGSYETGIASFGPQITSTPVTGPVEVVEDNTNKPSQGCQNLKNDLTGKIALIDRGTCEFGRKIVNAQNKGAIAAIICNFEEAVITMGAGAVGDQSTIPAVFIKSSDCATIRAQIENGLIVTLQAPSDPVGPDFMDGTLDNGIVSHEYGHGISNRLTGGPIQAGCLSNQEQMGEGWSDFFTLVFGARENDVPEQRRGIGTYVTREGNDGRGIRNYPYSTDMITNPFTYYNISGVSVPHGVGSVWCTMLWDLYWAMADKYGYDPDHSNKEAGNNKAIQLVMDGMKLQPCLPGFVDGRNAILAADQVLYGGENQCLIWEVFARRGLGVNASQGSSDSVTDGKEDFTVPDCRPELKVRKTVSPVINAGDPIEVTLTITNDLSFGVTGLVANDLIPANTEYIMGSSNVPVTQSGDALVFDIGGMASNTNKVITYQLSTPGYLDSKLLYYEPCEEENDDIWAQELSSATTLNPWGISDLFSKDGSNNWGILNFDTTSQSALIMINPVMLEGNQPVLRFSHRYDTEYRADGGFVEFSDDYGVTWKILTNDKIFRNSYADVPLQYATFTLPNIYAFFGSNPNWHDTYIDLSDYVGTEAVFQFRFGTDGNTANTSDGWFIDDFTLMDMYNYESEVCVSYDQGSDVCATAPGRGTVVEHSTANSTNDPVKGVLRVFPNPAHDMLYVQLDQVQSNDVEASILSIDGRVLWTNQYGNALSTTIQIPVGHLTEGVYVVKVQSREGIYTEKVIVRP